MRILVANSAESRPLRARAGASRAIAVALGAALAGCTVLPSPLDSQERERLAAQTQTALFAGQEPLKHPLTLEEAVARAIKYQADYRQRQMEQAAALAQIDVAKFDLLPRLTLNAGYTTRNNDSFGFGFSQNGQIAANPSASSERMRDTMTVGFAWNLLDFGVSYFRARQLADQSLIATERRRKAVQTLMHDVRVAWWRAEAAQRLLPYADGLLEEVDQAIEKTRTIEARKLLPPLQTATLRRALLDLSQQIAFRRQDLAQSTVELAALVNVPPGSELIIAGPASTERQAPDLTANVDRLEALALRVRPEMPEEGYRARISSDEARKALAGLLPGMTLDLGHNFDSNRFLVNNTWTSAGISVVFNLVKAFSIPALGRSEEAQKRADDARRMAMAMAILAQTRIAAVRYRLIAEEFSIWDEASRDDDLIVKYLTSSAQVGVDSELELIRAKARAAASRMNRDLSYASVQAAMARLYNSVGYDAAPVEAEGRPVNELAALMRARFTELEKASFTARGEPERPRVALGEVSGVEGPVAKLVGEGAKRVLDIARVRMVPAGEAELRLDVGITAEPAIEGRVTARAVMQLVRKDAAKSGRAEFKTTLSAPVDDEQWRVFGEGVVYRILSDIAPPRSRSAPARVPLQVPRAGPVPDVAAAADFPAFDGGPLTLRLDPVLRSLESKPLSTLFNPR